MNIQKSIRILVLIVSILMGCGKDSPTQPEVAPPPDLFSLEGYGESLDTLYFKVWSDSSADWLHKIVVIGGTTYRVRMNTDSTQYYYSSEGYSGFQPRGENLIMFDKPLGSIPSSVEFNKEYKRETSFFYGGFVYTMTYHNSLIDTGTIAVPVGRFSSCIKMKSRVVLTAQGFYDESMADIWSAQGPGSIRLSDASGYTIEFVRGHVNGTDWGTVGSAARDDGAVKTSLRAQRITKAADAQHGSIIKGLRHMQGGLHAGGYRVIR